jgi:branched-chain amino acid transport system substrate-binding protein
MAPRLVVKLGGVAAAVVLLATACGGSSSGGSHAGASAVPSGPVLTKAPIKIGNVGSYSGLAGTTSKATSDAVQAWAKWTNAHGGIDGHPVQVFVKNDNGSVTQAEAAVKELVETDHVIAIVGQHDSGLETSWEKYIDGKNIPVIGGPMSSAAWLTDSNFFPAAATPINELTMIAYTTKLAGKNSYGIIYCAELPGCAQGPQLSSVLVPKLGLKYAGGLAVSASAPNYTSQCLALRSDGAQAVFTATSQDAAQRFIGDCAKQGYKPIWIDNPQNTSPEQVKSSTWDGAWLSADSFSWLSTVPGAVQFNQAMAAYAPKTPTNTSGTAGWAAAAVFGAAAAHVSASPTSADIYAGLYGLGADYTAGGLVPPTTFAKGKPATQKACGWYLQIKSGKVISPKGSSMVCLGA